MITDNLHDAVHEALKARFDSVPRDITRLLRETLDIPKLKRLNGVAAKCAVASGIVRTLKIC
jgi:hypothetical protein